MRRVQRLLLSAGLAGLATVGFVLVVGASADALMVLLFAGFCLQELGDGLLQGFSPGQKALQLLI